MNDKNFLQNICSSFDNLSEDGQVRIVAMIVGVLCLDKVINFLNNALSSQKKVHVEVNSDKLTCDISSQDTQV